MALTSFNFLCFLAVVLILYYIVPKRFQWMLLLVASYAFYLYSGVAQVFFLLGTTIVTYGSGMLMQKRRNRYKAELSAEPSMEKEKKQALKKKTAADIHKIQVLTVVLDLVVLAVVKYSDFAIKNINDVIKALGGSKNALPGLNLIVPLGISFYTFMAMGYVIDIGRGKYEAEKNPAKLALFLSFFPSIVQGPISRFDDVGKKLVEQHKLNYENITYGAQLIMWGFFKKLVIADRVAPVVSQIFSVKMFDKLSGTTMFFGMLCYAVQIYCDFSGGIDITRGVAQMMGIELPLNFERPYFSTSVAEYWRRWHITLGAWMREYVFYPIMLSKPMSKLSKKVKDKHGQKAAKYVPSVITPFIVFILIGIWHGANWRYVAFGLYNAVIVAGSVALEPVFKKMAEKLHINTESKGWKVFKIVRTFLILGISKILVKAASLKMAVKTIVKIFTSFNLAFGSEMVKYGFDLGYKNNIVLGLAVLLLFIISLLQENGVKIRESVGKKFIVVRWLLYFLLLIIILVFGIYGPEYDAASFIYQTY